MKKLIIVLLTAMSVLRLGATNPVYDVAANFSIAANPNGVWSYGWEGTNRSTFTLYSSEGVVDGDNAVPFSYWNSSAGSSLIEGNLSSQTGTADGGQAQLPPGSLWMAAGVPGGPDYFATARFTVPAGGGGYYSVASSANPVIIGSYAGAYEFHVSHNGVDLFGELLGAPQSASYSNVVLLAVGDTIDLLVGRGTNPTGSGAEAFVNATIGTIPATNAAPVVTGISPAAGPAAGGTSVTITGTEFVPGATVNFGTTAAAGVTVNSATSITAIAPAETTGIVDVTVVTGGGTSATGSVDRFTYVGAPTVTAVSPGAGPSAGGKSVTITGTGFVSGATVNFGTTAATDVTVNSVTSITAISPAETTGVVDVTVTTGLGTSATSGADQFAYDAVPAVTAVSPTAGPTAGGRSVTITGTGFVSGATVKFGAVAGTGVTVNSATSITVTSPAESAGTVNVTVTTPGGSSATGGADQFVYFAPPTVTAVSPSAGLLAGGTTVTITGTGFISGATVNFGTTAGTGVTVNSPTSITATSPAESAGTVHVTVATAGGTSATGSADRFSYDTVPLYDVAADFNIAANPNWVWSYGWEGSDRSAFTPYSSHGVANGDNDVPFSYWNSYPGSSLIEGNLSAQTGTADAGQATLPPGLLWMAAGIPGEPDYFSTARFTVPAGGGGYYSVAASVDPLIIGSLAGAYEFHVAHNGVDLYGEALGANQSASYSNAVLLAVGDTIDLLVGRGTNATASGAEPFVTARITLISPLPTVTAVSPSAGLLAGGTSVTITGTGFVAGATVNFGTTAATGVTVNSPTTITVTAPAESAGTVDVTVTTGAGTSATSSVDQFTYYPASAVAIGESVVANRSSYLEAGEVLLVRTNGTQALLTTELYDPYSVAFDASGNMVVACYQTPTGDYATNTAVDGGIFKINQYTLAVAEVSGFTNFVTPFGVAVEPDGHILVADLDANILGAIFRVDPATGEAVVLSKNSATYGTNFYWLAGIAVATNGGTETIYVTDHGDGSTLLPKVIAINPTTGVQTVAAQGAPFQNPDGLAVDPSGGGATNIYVADWQAGTVIQMGKTTGSWTLTPITTTPANTMQLPSHVAIDPGTGDLFVTDAMLPTVGNPVAGALWRISRGTFHIESSSSGGFFEQPRGIVIHP